jgi:hypothetical protein
MKKAVLYYIACVFLLTICLSACNGGRHPQAWQPKQHKKATAKVPKAYRSSAY